MKRWLIKFPRLNQLYERIGTSKPDNVLAGYIRRGEFEPLVQKHAELFDQILTQLDSNAWEDLIVKVLPYSYSKDKSRGWLQFWNHLNESRGYVLLKKRGYSDVKFIPPEKTVKGKNEQFADLEGKSLVSRAILDVKTINLSDAEIERNKKRNDPTFSVGTKKRRGDIIGLSAFAKKLFQQTDPVSSFLWEQLEKPARKLLSDFVHGSSDKTDVESNLVKNMNHIIEGPCIYDKIRYAGVHLQALTEHLLEGRREFTGSVCLNRCLLDDAYPQELLKWSSVLSVFVYRPDLPVPVELQNKLGNAVKLARDQITATQNRPSQQNELPVKERIVLLLINRDSGCSPISLKHLKETLQQQPDLEVICQDGEPCNCE